MSVRNSTSLAAHVLHLVYFGLLIAAVTGWVGNILKLVAILDAEPSAMLIARIFGVPFAPLGVVLGFL